MRERRIGIDILSDDDGDDPILSVVNIVDVFLVVIAVLLIAVIENPLNPFAAQDLIVIRNPGKPDMGMLVREGRELKEYRSSGQIGEGEGAKAGTAYRLRDGSMVYVPEETTGDRPTPADASARKAADEPGAKP
ncbi:MAG: DUF2149 domain-containing protein [Burkholderiaceae bacterium]|nr:DUF2149 domain-containing protein [Burkholderiaceae bacterium]MCD6672231.1 DUF2149 domain-containing protein [Burkholderiaceae bacterium]